MGEVPVVRDITLENGRFGDYLIFLTKIEVSPPNRVLWDMSLIKDRPNDVKFVSVRERPADEEE